jgi:tRNA A37 threonylcarbamoyladenosine modification protein TsaB
MSEKDLTLSIETGIQGGSLSVLRGIKEIDYWIGSKEISKSEDVLHEIKNIFERNNLIKKELKRIIVSEGPGSHTGVRIGTAIGIGLKKALSCELERVFVLKAMLWLAAEGESVNSEEEIITAVPIGRNQICRQTFKLQNQRIINNESELQFSTIEEFTDFAINSVFQYKTKIIMHRKLYLDYLANLKNSSAANCLIIDAGKNIAGLNGYQNEYSYEYSDRNN